MKSLKISNKKTFRGSEKKRRTKGKREKKNRKRSRKNKKSRNNKKKYKGGSNDIVVGNLQKETKITNDNDIHTEFIQYKENLENNHEKDVTVIKNDKDSDEYIAVILPTHYSVWLQKDKMQYNTFKNIVIIDDLTYNFLDPLQCKVHNNPAPVPYLDENGKTVYWDPNPFIKKAINVIKEYKCISVISFDCFPNLLTSIINKKMQDLNTNYFIGSGPSILSCFICTNKYYMRKNKNVILGYTIDCYSSINEIPEDSQDEYVLKLTDAQFYAGTYPFKKKEDLNAIVDANPLYSSVLGISNPIIKSRQNFYYDLLKEYCNGDFIEPNVIKNANDIVLVHIEPFFGKGLLREQQVEIVVQNGNIYIHDSGDLIKCEEAQAVQTFKTKTSLEFDKWNKFIKELVIDKLVGLGWNNGAMDIEFVIDENDKLQLIEVNCRYSFMGYHRFNSLCNENCEKDMGHESNSIKRNEAKFIELGESLKGTYSDTVNVRNFNNRIYLSLSESKKYNAEVLYIPYRDEPKTTIIAFCIYFKPKEFPLNINNIFKEPLILSENNENNENNLMVENYTGEGPINLRNYTDKDHFLLQKYNGYDKLGFIFITIENNIDYINKWFTNLYKYMFPPTNKNYDAPVPTLKEYSTDVKWNIYTGN